MWVHNRFLEVTGTIKYENDQVLSSGLVNYNSPYLIETGVRFSILDRDTFIREGEESLRTKYDILIVQFGHKQLRNLAATGIEIQVGRTRLDYDGDEFRAIQVDNWGQKYNKQYMNIGAIQVRFERRVPVAY